jgi:hypothetical protein
MRLGIMLPDELQHQKLVEVGVKQRSRDGIEVPVVVMCPLGEVHNHRFITLTGFRCFYGSGRFRIVSKIHVQAKTGDPGRTAVLVISRIGDEL